jgi:GST-like protein
MEGSQFTSGFTEICPNGKIPALVDYDGPDGAPISVFESASIMLYLAEKYNKFISNDPRKRVEVINNDINLIQ